MKSVVISCKNSDNELMSLVQKNPVPIQIDEIDKIKINR